MKCFPSWFPIVLSCHISLPLDNICLAYSTKANPCKLILIYRPQIPFFPLPQTSLQPSQSIILTESLAVLASAEVQNNGWEVLCEICDIWQNLLLSFTYKWSSVSGPDVSQSPRGMAAWKFERNLEGAMSMKKKKISDQTYEPLIFNDALLFLTEIIFSTDDPCWQVVYSILDKGCE